MVPILEEQGGIGICVCVLVAVVLGGGVIGQFGSGSRMVGWC